MAKGEAMTRPRKVAIAAGGTAGHVNPALALAQELRDRGDEVRFFGETRRLEGRLVPEAGFDFFPVEVTGFDRSRPWTLVTALAHLRHEQRRLARYFSENPDACPDVAVGFGAYVELPLVRAAARLGVPVALHEQNSVPGLANKQSARIAALIAIAQPSVEAVFASRKGAGTRIVMTGNPVRRSVLEGDRARGRAKLGIPSDATVLLVFGGSLGAKHINEAMARLAPTLLAHEGVYVVHATGEDGYEATRAALNLADGVSERYRVFPYIKDMGDTLAAADLVVSRSGASSVAEIAALAVPSILVPYPLATEDHQTTNARFLTDVGAAILVPDDELDAPRFAQELERLLTDASVRDRMAACARGLGQDRAAARLADEVEGLCA